MDRETTRIAVIGGGIAYGITQLGKDTGNGAQQGTKAPARRVQSPAAKSKSGSLKPSDVDVTVLNGTTVANLAHNFGTKLENDGFKVENQLTANRGQVAESAVLFKSGANREAQLVARKLDITQIEPADPQSASQAGAADVVVVIGSDLAH
jgi:hypothetical protein